MIQIRLRQVYSDLELKISTAWMSRDDFNENEEERFYLFLDQLRKMFLKKLEYV